MSDPTQTFLANDLLTIPSTRPLIEDVAGLRAALLTWVEENVEYHPQAVVKLNRIYNKVATRYETTVLDQLLELHKENKLTVFLHMKSSSNYVISASYAASLVESVKKELEEAKREVSAGNVSNALIASLQKITTRSKLIKGQQETDPE